MELESEHLGLNSTPGQFAEFESELPALNNIIGLFTELESDLSELNAPLDSLLNLNLRFQC